MTPFLVAQTRVPMTREDVIWFVIQLIVIASALLAAGLTRELIGPYLRRRWPRTATLIDGVLPLPCEHVDAAGASITYRERRPLNGRLVLHLICPACGHVQPLITRSDEEREVFAALKPAHEQLRARLKTPVPPASTLEFDPSKRSRLR